jgi:hypothetical protein
MLVVTLFCAAGILSCKKGDDNNNNPPVVDPIPQENKLEAAALDSFLETNQFRLTRYFSDSAIDYIDTDQVVKAETDLWQYVSPWLKDDGYKFQTDGQVLIEQNTDKIESDNSLTLLRPYKVEADEEGVAFKFMGHEYQPLDYRLISFTDSVLIVSATWNGKVVQSEYKVVP